MLKTHYIFSLFFLFITFLAQGQSVIEGKILKQTDQMTAYHFNLKDIDHQKLSLSLEINYQDETLITEGAFLSLQMTKANGEKLEALEFARIYLPSHLIQQKSITYDFDLILWQSLLRENKAIQIYHSEKNSHVKIQTSLITVLGKPPFIVKSIIPLWQSDMNGFEYGKNGISKENLPNQNIKLPEGTEHAFIDILVSGKSEEGDAEAKFYFIKLNGEELAKRSIWRDDCSNNPLYPQMGNWHMEQPNWCPGLRVHPSSHFLEEKYLMAKELEIELSFQEDPLEESGIDSYVISAVVFALGEAPEKLNAEIKEILAPNNNLWHQRYNPICGAPVLFIQNTGSETIKSITFNYGYNYQTDTKFRWKGELGFMEEELIYLPPLNWYFYENDDQPETFTVHISAINGEKDAYVHSKKTSNMVLAEVFPSELQFEIQTDDAAHANGLEIFDDTGDLFFYSGVLKADSLYQFNIEFKAGCYEMIFFDEEGNGLHLQSSHFMRIIDSKKELEIKKFPCDFGAEVREQFMIFKK